MWRRKAWTSYDMGCAAEGAGRGDLQRHLGAFGLVMLGIGGIIGAGVFVLTGLVAHDIAGPSVVVRCAYCYGRGEGAGVDAPLQGPISPTPNPSSSSSYSLLQAWRCPERATVTQDMHKPTNHNPLLLVVRGCQLCHRWVGIHGGSALLC